MQTIFALASGRSGTTFLYELFRHNARNCVCRHEPYFSWSNPDMFGRPIYDHARGNYQAIRDQLAKKERWIRRVQPRTYVETSHAFLKSYYDLAPEFFPQMKLVHLVRNPLKVAKSEENRENKLHQVHFPFRKYRGDDGRKYFRWALTGLEPIFASFAGERLSKFQRYVIQWIEIENRAMQFLEKFGKRGECITLHSPHELNDLEKVTSMFRFLGVECREPLKIAGRHNRTPGAQTVLTEDDQAEFRQVIEGLPAASLEIFRRAPYDRFDWSSQLRKTAARDAA